MKKRNRDPKRLAGTTGTEFDRAKDGCETLPTGLENMPEVREYLAGIGRKGGQKSRRTLTSEQAKLMRSKRRS